MKYRALIYLVSFSTILWSLSACKESESAQEIVAGTEIQVSETRKNGRYVRTTETFLDKVRVSRKTEVSLRDNGEIDQVFIKLWRGGDAIFGSVSDNIEKITVRNYMRFGEVFFAEGDLDGDGFFEMRLVYDAQLMPVEAFSISKDGTVMPFSENKLEEYKRSDRIFR